jgi:ATP-binding cassette, subfamily F, member 3
MISINDFTKSFERDNLFENLSITIHPNNRIALVGGNGTGKTTLLKCLVGQEDFQGRIESSEIKISLMEQEKNFSNLDKTFNDYIQEKNRSQEEKIKALEIKLGDPQIYEDENQFNLIINKYNLLVATAQLNPNNKKLIDTLNSLGIDNKILNQKISELSGGQKIKLRLAECISKTADIYLLDEPTNHLDLESIEWLEQYIQQNIKSLIAVSHDRYFLNKIINKVWEIENKTIKTYNGNYESYKRQKESHLKILRKRFKDLTKKKEELLKSAEEKYQWMQKNKSPKLKALGDRLKRDAKRIEIPPNPDKFRLDININFSNKKLHNCEIFRMVDLTKQFDKTVILENTNKNIDSGEKIAIIGGNGAGKTTILKMLTGEENASEGTIEKRSNLKIGYFDQELTDVNQELTVIKFLEQETSKNDQHIISILLNFGFGKESFDKKIKQLSGGEKGRLNLLRITQENNEVLLLDEPTNNLDIYLKDSLEKAIKNFEGTVIFVSHDRHFIDNVATRILEIKNKKIKSHNGNYSDYMEFKQKQTPHLSAHSQ